MTEPLRVLMRDRRGAQVLSVEDIHASFTPNAKYGRRFSLDIAEEALTRMGAEAVPMMMDRLAESVVMREHPNLSAIIYKDYLHNRPWVEPIVKEVLQGIIREYVVDVFAHLITSERIEALEARLAKLEAPR